MRFVLGEQLVAKRLSRRIENDSELRRVVFAQKLEQHVDDAEHGASRFTLGIGEGGKGVESPIEIRGAVDEYEVDLIHDGFSIKAGRYSNTVRLINE
jgi:hypothetical protein